MKKPVIIFLIGILVLVTLYIGESVYIGVTVSSIVDQSYNTYGEINNYNDIVSDDIYKSMCYRDGDLISSKERDDVKETNHRSFPIAIHWIFGGTATYVYTYESYDKNGEAISGSSGIPVTITFCIQQGKLKIIDKYEAP